MPKGKGYGPKRKKSRAAQPIGPGKKGSLKRKVYKSGGGKKTLKTARSLNKPTLKAAKGYAKNVGMKKVVQKYRSVRSNTGRNPTTGQAGYSGPSIRAPGSGPTKKHKTVARIAKRKGISRAAANKVRKSR